MSDLSIKSLFVEGENKLDYSKFIYEILYSCNSITYLGISPKNDSHLFPPNIELRYIAYTDKDLEDLGNVIKKLKSQSNQMKLFIKKRRSI